MPNGFWEAFILAVLCGFIAELVRSWKELKALARKTRSFFGIRRTGLKAIFRRSDEPGRLQELIDRARDRDELMIIGRTVRGVVESNEPGIEAALVRGVIVKFLFLDSGVVRERGDGRSIDLRSLGIRDAQRTLAEDIGFSEAKLKSIRENCEKNRWRGSLLVYQTTVLLQNSAVILFPKLDDAPIRILYDFSFGTEQSDKWVQYYRARKNKTERFPNKLTTFYRNMFNKESSKFAYSLSYRFTADGPVAKELETVAAERIRSVIDTHPGGENVRANALQRILPGAAAVFRSLHDTRIQIPPPLSVQVELTNKCTTSCEHCSRWKRADLPEMKKDVAVGLLDDLAALGVGTVTFSGGEPTAHSSFVEILRHAASKNLKIGVLSNGVGLSDDTINAIYDCADWLRLSIDGSSPRVYDRVRKSLPRHRDAFEAVKSTVHRLSERNRQAAKCRLAICYTIQSKNADDVRDVIRWVRSLGIPDGDRCLSLKFAHGRDSDGKFLCTKDEIRELFNDVFTDPEFAHTPAVEYLHWFLNHQSSISDLAAGRPTQGLYSQQETRCFTPHIFSLVDPRGDVYPCCFLFEDNDDYTKITERLRKRHLMGSLENARFADIWKGSEYERVRRELSVIEPAEKYSSCGYCTRHCNHNVWLTKIYAEYEGLRTAKGNADEVMKGISDSQSGPVWL